MGLGHGLVGGGEDELLDQPVIVWSGGERIGGGVRVLRERGDGAGSSWTLRTFSLPLTVTRTAAGSGFRFDGFLFEFVLHGLEFFLEFTRVSHEAGDLF